MFWIGGGGCLNSQLSVVSGQRSAGFSGFIGFSGLKEAGIGVPSYRRIGVTNPSHKRYNRYKESGLQTPPTRDITIKNRGYETPPIGNRSYKPLLQKNRGTNPSHKRYNPSHKRYNHKESGLQTPPTKDITPPTRDITIKNRGYKPLPQEDITAIKNRGYKPLLQKITIPFPEEIRVDVGVSSL